MCRAVIRNKEITNSEQPTFIKLIHTDVSLDFYGTNNYLWLSQVGKRTRHFCYIDKI